MEYTEYSDILSVRSLDKNTIPMIYKMHRDMINPVSIVFLPYANNKAEMLANYNKFLKRIYEKVLVSSFTKHGTQLLHISFPECGLSEDLHHIHATIDIRYKDSEYMKKYIRQTWANLNHNGDETDEKLKAYLKRNRSKMKFCIGGKVSYPRNDGSHDIDRYVEYSMKWQTKEQPTVIGNLILDYIHNS